MVKLSEQQLLDCTINSFGCKGGYVPAAFEFFKNNFVAIRDSYGYKGLRAIK